MPWHNERIPETMQAFSKLRETIFKDGALDVKTKEAISVAMFVAAGSQLHWTDSYEEIMKGCE